ncbi:hypothetical protein [Microvirga massiliensis]|uniref:hypothetical protein n=1 Tax=Microvirga massiliensis TaxID=1033741 RepID=UPI00062B2FF3|nr:hypothetical protein [Microvirga massiliensis]
MGRRSGWPDAPSIVVASPCFGHGFKFESLVGEMLADLVTQGICKLDPSPFDINRFQGASVTPWAHQAVLDEHSRVWNFGPLLIGRRKGQDPGLHVVYQK